MKRLATLLVVAIAAIGMSFSGAVVADDGDIVIDEEIDADDDIEEIWADVTASDELEDTEAVEVTFTVEGVDEDDETTELDSQTADIDANEIESFAYEPSESDVEDYETFELTVEVTDEEFTADDISDSEWGTLESIVGGGGGIGGVGGVGSTGLIAVLVILGGAWFFSQD